MLLRDWPLPSRVPGCSLHWTHILGPTPHTPPGHCLQSDSHLPAHLAPPEFGQGVASLGLNKSASLLTNPG